jgi:RibD C-terminal domain
VLWGSSTLTSTLLEHGLADEVMLVVYPALLGAGKRLFAEGTPGRSFELVSTQALPSGTIISNYRVAGPLKDWIVRRREHFSEYLERCNLADMNDVGIGSSPCLPLNH